MKAELHMVRERPTVIVTTAVGEIPTLYDALHLQTEGNKIYSIREYYYCPDLLVEIARELCMPVHSNGYTYKGT